MANRGKIAGKTQAVAEYLEHGRRELVRLAEELHGGKYAPCLMEYFAYGCDTPSRSMLYRRFGRWENFVATTGLMLAEPSYYYEQSKRRGQTLGQAQAQRVQEIEEQMEQTARRIAASAVDVEAELHPKGMQAKPVQKRIYNWQRRCHEIVTVFALI
jgi:hypothetical protein